ncbi:MAG TPA: type II toxin-antitoxin system HicB family antitoxin [Acidocella sp.]|uniref:type II toxin-antitoxin system HicB family antitoxin n=1 Tax=Acidocella sp. TaxID=50710 RepID=UPI002C4060AB|nr:type II toxin-antitoxin system HicB family antitoxin [Acidocella sp.]HVE23103.1 type II toxin-antitoxin system HicB family antitoxin [Acidocella sp.]
MAIIERSSDGFGVFFPDVDGCTSAGDTVEEATANASEALNSHLALCLEDGEALPEARDSDAIERDPDVDEVARVLIRYSVRARA